jgi:Ca2+-binding RTX toxin-like protein
VFVKPGAWSGALDETAKLTASDGAATDSFGYAVAVAGDTVVSGAVLHATGGIAKGAAYVFVKPAAGWASTSTFDAELTASDGAPTDRLGESVAIVGNTVVAGARFAAGPNHVDQGAAYVYVEPPGGWTSTSTFDDKLTAADGAGSDNFGAAVAFSGGNVAVGAFGDQSGAGPFQGSAYVFVVSDTTPPVITPSVSGTLGGDGWYVSDVTVAWTVTDPESAVTSTSGCDTTVIAADTAGLTLTCTATSGGGTQSESVTVKRDATPPVITLVTPPDGASYDLDAVVNADYGCADSLSGLVSCAGPVAPGSPIDTASAGPHAFTVTADDAAGNAAQVSAGYVVLLLCGGLTPTILGTPGSDTITGTKQRDVIHGLSGDDTIKGLGGQDVICGGTGNDTLNGGNGADVLLGGGENDTLNGRGGADVLDGGGGDDILNGDSGNDALDGGAGTDVCNGAQGTADTAANCETQTGIP